MAMADGKVVVITGGNSGVGLAIAKQLLGQATLVLMCRSQKKAEAARQYLLTINPRATVHLVELDTSSVDSVISASRALHKLCPRINVLFCNAGTMPIESLNWPAIIGGLLTHPVEFFESSEAINQKRGSVTSDGLGQTFQTNVFGHYLLIHRTLALLRDGRIVWTGSSASRLNFSPSDYQHIHGTKSYESSKFIIDQITVPLNARLSQYNIRCVVAEPGNVCTNFLSGLGNCVLEFIILVAFYLIRTVGGLARFTITPDTACTACCHAGQAEAVDSHIKYYSCATRRGRPFIASRPLEYSEKTGTFLLNKLDALVARFDQP
ncbi:hypothetical protein GGI25_004168 [Coemansia spiralis]|uniref:Uncharacterized protein n=2 Tax=Coemansia TaxID=4863 RepID=A0A9W8G770_9FUNG|nr:hypothetical protein BX070DRAFT_230694 [Coemansia spiralis]KAJ1987875.1 hypothetical protein EDC05_005606 [Coemansia umbellata]KAJ2620491.1 hypothetical protein GGI26_004979 [Coemansia sp. RSA 1358]KAJ2675020.1 hypothetical protein GGI25_004168 [Coemansia spiralis]